MNPSTARAAFPTWPEPTRPGSMRTVDAPAAPGTLHVIPSLSLGGAERIGVELAVRASRRGSRSVLAVMREAPVEHAVPEGPATLRLGSLAWPDRIRAVASASTVTGGLAYCHLTSLDEMRRLWELGVDTVPVVHNVVDGWRQDPREWAGGRVPFAVACGIKVSLDLARARCPVPVVPLRHVVEPPPRPSPDMVAATRSALSAGARKFLVGMVGRVVAQKDYPRAVRALAAIRARGEDARLVVVGAISEPEAHAAAVAEAIRLGVREDVLFVGGVNEGASLLPAFDVFLNTSLFEGVSISTMEAVAAGVPVASLDVGGQSEAVGPLDALLSPGSTDDEIALGTLAAAARGHYSPPPKNPWQDAVTDLWGWIAAARTGGLSKEASSDVLFVTGNLDVGGAQRSLTNLSTELAGRGRRVRVAVCGPVGVPDFLDDMLAAGVECLDLSGGSRKGGPAGRLARILAVAFEAPPVSLCFWNMDAATKFAVARALSGSPIRLVDASPGPALFREMEEAWEAGEALTTNSGRYLRSLDAFVSKYAGGLPRKGRRPPVLATIPNGVRVSDTLPAGEGPSPEGDASKAVLVVGRLAPAKRPDLLPRIADALAARTPGATLTVVGGVHAGSGSLRGSPHLRMVGPDTRAAAFAGRFACFLMISDEQGCPNASLEAMSAGVPVVANDDGGTSEQVVDGRTGFLLPNGLDDDALVDAAVEALARVLSEPGLRDRLGAAARRHVRENFTMSAMADGYDAILFPKE